MHDTRTAARGARQLTTDDVAPPEMRRRRRSSRPLGPFAFLVIRVVAYLSARTAAYGLNIEEKVSQVLGAVVDLAQIYVTLKRLEERGFLVGTDARAPGGTGHTVTAYKLTDAGVEAMKVSSIFYQVLTQPLGDGDNTNVLHQTPHENAKRKKKGRTRP